MSIFTNVIFVEDLKICQSIFIVRCCILLFWGIVRLEEAPTCYTVRL